MECSVQGPHFCSQPCLVSTTDKIKSALARHKQILADDQYIVGHAINKHLLEMFDELETLIQA